MAVVQETIKQAIIAMQNELKEIEDTEEAQERSAEVLAGIIRDAILSADVLGVVTTVSGTSPSGPVTGTGTQNNTGNLQ